MEFVVFVIAAVIVLVGGLGVIVSRNPVHAALSLVATLFGIAILFVEQHAHFLAAVQVIVYAGAIVVLFLFVIMLLGVDKAEDLGQEPLVGQRPAAVLLGLAGFGLTLTAILRSTDPDLPGRQSVVRALDDQSANVVELAKLLFTRYLFAFEVTSILLVIAVVAAVVLARRPPAETIEPVIRSGAPEPTAEEVP